jgi:EamA domain-containing membrane protein RarD
MQPLGRFLQFVGLTIPPLAMIAQLGEHISAGKMLQFLMVAVGVFVLGYTMQRFSK